MITREMIRNGFESGTVSIEEEYAGCIGICCRVGDNAFYFLVSEDNDLTKEEYWESHTLDMTIDMIFNILKDVESAEEHGLDETELDYYTSVLAYQPNETKISQDLEIHAVQHGFHSYEELKEEGYSIEILESDIIEEEKVCCSQIWTEL